ncbi:MAG: hypothetical protein U9Q79_10790 [Candidatus Hydrogenedentes bacterium]|nr:hypothetical protein [Candidatus Hydrogenedentota bacterium]
MATLLILLCAAFGAADNAVVFFEDFGDPGKGREWAGERYNLIEIDGRTCLRISNDDPQKSATVHIPLDAAQIAGKLLTGRAILKASDISTPPNSWNGIKVMLVLQKDGDTVYPQMPMPAGTFEWRKAVETIRVPTGIQKAHVVFGLEKVTGTVWFEEVELRLGRPSGEGRRNAPPFADMTCPAFEARCTVPISTNPTCATWALPGTRTTCAGN